MYEELPEPKAKKENDVINTGRKDSDPPGRLLFLIYFFFLLL